MLFNIGGADRTLEVSSSAMASPTYIINQLVRVYTNTPLLPKYQDRILDAMVKAGAAELCKIKKEVEHGMPCSICPLKGGK